MQKIKKGDIVQVMRGKDSGKRGVVKKVIKSKDGKVSKVVVEGANKIKKTIKPNPRIGKKGGILEMESPIDVSNVMLVDPKLNIPTRVGFTFDKETGKKYRYSKKSNEILA
jgi:large subunit ribosomal protein L24